MSQDISILRIGYDQQPPFRFTNAQGKAEGIDINRISAVLDKAGIDYEFQPYPWKRILRYIQSGQLDIALAAADLEERKVYSWFSNEVFNQGLNVLLVHPEAVELFENMSSLASLRSMDIKIGIRRGASYSNEYELLLNDDAFTSRLVSLGDVSQAIKLTLAGRIAGFISSPYIVKFEAQKACIKTDFIQVYNLTEKENSETHLMYSKQTVNQAMVARVDEAMREVDSASDKFDKAYIRPNFNCPPSE